MRRTAVLLAAIVAAGCGGSRETHTWSRRRSVVESSPLEDEVPWELDWIHFDGQRIVERALPEQTGDEYPRPILCQERVEVRRVDGETVELVTSALQEWEFRLFLWHGLLMLETSEGYIAPYRPCLSDCTDVPAEVPSALPNCGDPSTW